MPKPKTSAEFATELETDGCAIKWNDGPGEQRGFTATVRQGPRRGRSVLVWFYNGDDQFYCAWDAGYQIRSMVAVRRALGLES